MGAVVLKMAEGQKRGGKMKMSVANFSFRVSKLSLPAPRSEANIGRRGKEAALTLVGEAFLAHS